MVSPATTHPATGAPVDSSPHTAPVAVQKFTVTVKVSHAQEETGAGTATWRELLAKYQEALDTDTQAACATQEKAFTDIQAFGAALKDAQKIGGGDMRGWLYARAKMDIERDVERRRLLVDAQEKLDAALAAIHAPAEGVHRPRTDDAACGAEYIAAMTAVKAQSAKAEEMLGRARSNIRDLERAVAFKVPFVYFW